MTYTITQAMLDAHLLWLRTRFGDAPQGARLCVSPRADLTGAVLTDAVLTRAVLTRADLTGADLTRANLTGAVLTGADLTDAVGIRAPVLPHLDARILAAVEGDAALGALDMDDWHKCETTHCRAGWAIHLAGDAGYMLEDRIGPAAAGALIYAASRPGQPVPNFYASTEDALDDLRRGADADPLGEVAR